MIISVEVQLSLQEGQGWVGEVALGLVMVVGTAVHLSVHLKCSQEPSLTVVKLTTLLRNSV